MSAASPCNLDHDDAGLRANEGTTVMAYQHGLQIGLVRLASLGLVTMAAAASAGEVNTGYFGNTAIKGYDPVA